MYAKTMTAACLVPASLPAGPWGPLHATVRRSSRCRRKPVSQKCRIYARRAYQLRCRAAHREYKQGLNSNPHQKPPNPKKNTHPGKKPPNPHRPLRKLPQHLPDFGPQVHGADHVLTQGQGTRCCRQASSSYKGRAGVSGFGL